MRNLERTLFLVLSLAICFNVFMAFQASANNGFSIDDVMKIKHVQSVQLSENGEFIAYTLSEPADPRNENKRSESHLYVYNINTDEAIPFFTRAGVGNVRFRPGHESITFTANAEEADNRSIYEISLHGGEAQVIYAFENSIRNYEWAPDGDRLVFTARKPGKEEKSDFPYKPEVFEEGLTDVGGYIKSFNGDDSEALPIETEGTVYGLRWSPEGGRIAVSVAPTSLVDHRLMYQQVQIANPENGEIVAEIDNEGKLSDIQWSPDGNRLALLAGHDLHDPTDGRIMVVNADGGKPENIYPEFEGKFEQIEWTGANTIHFIASQSTERGFGTIHPDGSNFSYTLGLGGPIYDQFSYLDDQRIAFLASTPKHPGEVYLQSGSQSEPQRITNSNPWIEERTFGEQRVISYEARDGLELEGLLILPVDYQEGRAVPLIVQVHGGPEAHYSNGWMTDYRKPGQEGAAKGYAVFFPNYRGSTGRGIDFIKSSQGDAAGAEFDDVIDGLDYLIETGIADPERVGVMGSSYGGYATAWMSTYYSDRFSAAFMNVGLSNKVSKWGTTDIPDEIYLVHFREYIWENNNWQKYLERSPIYYVDNAQTPIKITHGADDTRVHPSQSLELYRHLKARKPDLPVRYVKYTGEGHSYSRASAQYDYNIRMFRWFDAFLMGDGTVPDMEIDYDTEW